MTFPKRCHHLDSVWTRKPLLNDWNDYEINVVKKTRWNPGMSLPLFVLGMETAQTLHTFSSYRLLDLACFQEGVGRGSVPRTLDVCSGNVCAFPDSLEPDVEQRRVSCACFSIVSALIPLKSWHCDAIFKGVKPNYLTQHVDLEFDSRLACYVLTMFLRMCGFCTSNPEKREYA